MDSVLKLHTLNQLYQRVPEFNLCIQWCLLWVNSYAINKWAKNVNNDISKDLPLERLAIYMKTLCLTSLNMSLRVVNNYEIRLVLTHAQLKHVKLHSYMQLRIASITLIYTSQGVFLYKKNNFLNALKYLYVIPCGENTFTFISFLVLNSCGLICEARWS